MNFKTGDRVKHIFNGYGYVVSGEFDEWFKQYCYSVDYDDGWTDDCVFEYEIEAVNEVNERLVKESVKTFVQNIRNYTDIQEVKDLIDDFWEE